MTAARLELEPDLTIHSALTVNARLLAFLDEAGDLELDLSRVDDMDSAGLQLLLLVRREALARGLRLNVTGISPVVEDVLAIAWLAEDLSPLTADAEEQR